MRTSSSLIAAVLSLCVPQWVACNNSGESDAPETVSVDDELPLLRHEDCPAGMAYVLYRELSYCIDAHEAPGFGRQPTLTTLSDARSECDARRATLCGEAEWERACRGPNGRRYPYGDTHSGSVCNIATGAPVDSGDRTACRSGFGAYDMSGNVAEWVGEGFLRGGDASSAGPNASRCASRELADSPSAPELRGYRCCLAVDPAE